MIRNKKILIIGGTGSLGKALIRKYQSQNDLLIFSRDEHKHVALEKTDWVSKNVRFKVGDIKEKESIFSAISEFNPHIIINAAAMKHVPICEENVYESVKTNIIGHQNLIDSIRTYKKDIETLIFVSTDKACKPINVYGMCKAISEKLYIDFSQKQKDTEVYIVRYGNVLESTGSIIPHFKNLIKNGEKFLPITDMEMTRFLLSLEDACDLIDWAYNSNTNGKIAIPKVKSMKIVDLANYLIEIFGEGRHIELKAVGIRFGEKIHEELISSEEWLRTEERENYIVCNEKHGFEPRWKTNSKNTSYSSKDFLMNKDEVGTFFEKK